MLSLESFIGFSGLSSQMWRIPFILTSKRMNKWVFRKTNHLSRCTSCLIPQILLIISCDIIYHMTYHITHITSQHINITWQTSYHTTSHHHDHTTHIISYTAVNTLHALTNSPTFILGTKVKLQRFDLGFPNNAWEWRRSVGNFSPYQLNKKPLSYSWFSQRVP